VVLFAGLGREELRRQYLEAWRKHRAGELLSPLEAQLAALIAEHPEYHDCLARGEAVLQEDFGPERGTSNPFLHLGMHLALRDQVATDRPPGIARIHRRLARRLGGAHEAEHAMLEVLGETLWEAQRAGHAPDEQRYLERLAALPRRRS
jgi:hypothetical protein